MKTTPIKICLVLSSVLLLGACSDNNDAIVDIRPPPPPPVPLAWDMANWDEVVWQ